jgi:hypothetical protein
MFDVANLLGKKVLIVGDVGSGKTVLTLKIVYGLIDLGFGGRISILDFAPNLMLHCGRRVGGKFTDYSFNPKLVRMYIPVETIPPRILGKCRDEVLMYANMNRGRCGDAIKLFIDDPSDILVINDLSLYFHVGDLGLIVDAMKLCKTFIANAYFDGFIEDKFSMGISINEREVTMNLMKIVDIVINLNVQGVRVM